jgi:sodium transport system ATP-binding protein
MLGTIIQPTSGHCTVGGFRADESPLEVRRHVGFLSGNTKLYGRLTGNEMLRYFGKLYGMSEATIDRRVTELSARLGMAEFADQRCDTLSTGQAQRVNVARVLLHDPPLLILDEPTLGLDILTSSTILDFILERKAEGRCVILSTHIMTDAEMLCDRIALMHRGRLLAIGPKETLYEQTSTKNLKDAFVTLVGTGLEQSS